MRLRCNAKSREHRISRKTGQSERRAQSCAYVLLLCCVPCCRDFWGKMLSGGSERDGVSRLSALDRHQAMMEQQQFVPPSFSATRLSTRLTSSSCSLYPLEENPFVPFLQQPQPACQLRPSLTISSPPLSTQATPEQRNLVNYLRGKTGPKVRSGLLNGKRTDYFKGPSVPHFPFAHGASSPLRPSELTSLLTLCLWFGTTGKTAIKVLLSDEYKKQKKVPQVANEEEAAKLLHSIIPLSVPLPPSVPLFPPPTALSLVHLD